MTHKEYNGWHNYETWVVSLWLNNEEWRQRYWDEVAEWAANKTKGDRDAAVRELADNLKEQHEAEMQELLEQAKEDASVWADLLKGALSEVNWREIAEGKLELAGSETIKP